MLAGEKTVFLSHLYIKMMILPRQARDKHRENSKKEAVLSQLDAMTSEGDLKRGSGNEYNKAKRTGTN